MAFSTNLQVAEPDEGVWELGWIGVEVTVLEVGVAVPAIAFVAAEGGGGGCEGCQERGEGWGVEQHDS
jgi:hypothetical protein